MNAIEHHMELVKRLQESVNNRTKADREVKLCIFDCYQAGISLQSIGEIMDLSKQRIHQIVQQVKPF